MRLIDADAFVRMMEEKHDPSAELDPIILSVCRGAIATMPTVDAVPVVRCCECKYVGTDATCCLVCKREGMGLRPFHVHHDDYCSYGERKDSDGNE